MVLHVQVLLDRAHVSPGKIGHDGANTWAALEAFRNHRQLPDATAAEAALAGDGAPAVAEYAVAEADVAGPVEAESPRT